MAVITPNLATHILKDTKRAAKVMRLFYERTKRFAQVPLLAFLVPQTYRQKLTLAAAEVLLLELLLFRLARSRAETTA